MAEGDPLTEVFNLFAAPLAGSIRSIEQFRKGVDEFLRGVENFNRTMENLNETTERINRLVADVEPPLRAAIPQITRSVKAADEMFQVVSGPAMAVAPGLERLAQMLSTPAFSQLPTQLGQVSDVLGDLSSRLGPLTQLAESAGGLFGGFRLPGLPGPKPPATPPSAPADAEQPAGPTARLVADTASTDAPAKKTPAKKTPAKKTPAKRSTAKKRAAKKAAAKKSPAKKSPARKSAATKTASAED